MLNVYAAFGRDHVAFSLDSDEMNNRSVEYDFRSDLDFDNRYTVLSRLGDHPDSAPMDALLQRVMDNAVDTHNMTNSDILECTIALTDDEVYLVNRHG